MPAMITQEQLKEALSYCPETGIFIRLLAKSPNTKVGDVAGWKTAQGYIDLKINGQTYKAHRLAFLYMTGKFPDDDVDHINLKKSDNRYANLRLATRSQNIFNMELKKNNTSGFKNVSFHKATGKFIAVMRIDGVEKYLGLHKTAEDANKAIIEIKKQTRGEFFRESSLIED